MFVVTVNGSNTQLYQGGGQCFMSMTVYTKYSISGLKADQSRCFITFVHCRITASGMVTSVVAKGTCQLGATRAEEVTRQFYG